METKHISWFITISWFSQKMMNSWKSSPTTPKSYKNIWKGIGSIRPGAFGPRRTRNHIFCKKNSGFSISQWISWICCEKCRFHRKKWFYNSPKPLRNQSFIDTFCEQGPLVWISMPDSLNLVNLPFLTASMPKKCSFRFQIHLLGTRRNSLYKRKHLGRVLEARDRKSAISHQKFINSSPTAEI